MRVLWENGEPFLQEGRHLHGHLIQVVQIRIGVHVAEASSHRIIDEQQVRKLIPASIIHAQCPIFLHPVRSNLHHCAIHATAPGSSIKPNHGPLTVGNMSILVEPEEHVTVVLGRDLNMARVHVEKRRGRAWE